MQSSFKAFIFLDLETTEKVNEIVTPSPSRGILEESPNSDIIADDAARDDTDDSTVNIGELDTEDDIIVALLQKQHPTDKGHFENVVLKQEVINPKGLSQRTTKIDLSLVHTTRQIQRNPHNASLFL